MQHRVPQHVVLPLAFAIVILLVLSAVPVPASHVSGNLGHPVHRTEGGAESGSFIAGQKPNAVLAATAPVWVSGLDPVPVTFVYRCNSGSDGPQALCWPGSAGSPGDPRTVTVQYTLDGSAPGAGSSTVSLEATSATPASQMTFTGAIPVEAAQEGARLNFRVQVDIEYSPLNPPPQAENCAGTSQAPPCTDPLHTTGQAGFYSLRVDRSIPAYVVGDPPNAIVHQLDENDWWLFSNNAMSSFLPTLNIGVADNSSGAPLDADGTQIERAGQDVTSQFIREALGSHGAIYAYNYPSGGSFPSNSVTEFRFIFADVAGNEIDTGSTDPGLRVIMDNQAPSVDTENSTLLADEEGPVGLGGNLRIHVNATDIAAEREGGVNSQDPTTLAEPLETPRDLLLVEARLVNGTTAGAWQTIPWNETEEHHFTHAFQVPASGVPSGRYSAEIRVTDVVGNTATAIDNNTVTIDADLPVIVPQEPVGAGADTKYVAERDVEFRIRATDPGNTDPWNGTNTESTDGLGIDFDQVFVHYRVGNGTQTSLLLQAQTENNTFSASHRFGEHDPVYYWFSVRDQAGNERVYPAAGDPHVTTSASANEGRALLVHTDLVGPVIEPGKDLTYLGGPDDPEFWFDITDEAVGPDPEEARLFWRLSGATEYTTVTLTEGSVEDPDTGAQRTTFRAQIPQQEDGAEVQWHVRALDLLENEATLGSANAPETTIIDLTPPTVTVNAPARSTDAIFNITWTGEDARSGVRDYTLQFRIAPDGRWVTVPERERTTLTSWDVCAATGRTYEFRLSARDMVGNERTFPPTADARTVVEAPESCAEPPRVTIDSPADGAVLQRDVEIRWRAISTPFPEELDIQVRVTSAAGQQTTLAEGLDIEGTYLWRTAAFSPNEPCFEDGTYTLAVAAVDPLRLEGIGQATVTLDNDITDCDARHGPSGPGGALEDFDPMYLLVVLAFTGLVGVFVVGMSRRW